MAYRQRPTHPLDSPNGRHRGGARRTRHLFALLGLSAFFSVVLLIFTIAWVSTAAYADADPNTLPQCGGVGQRACCVVEVGLLPALDSQLAHKCDIGLTEVTGCYDVTADGVNDCECVGGGTANSRCIKAAPCGGPGQRACCGGERIGGRSCSASEDGGFGLEESSGCSGDCTCGGEANPFNDVVNETCVHREDLGRIPYTAEPDTGWTASTSSPACALSGYADMHAHMFAELAHGGSVLAGKAYDPKEHDIPVLPENGVTRAFDRLADRAMHKGHGLQDPIGSGTKDGSIHNFGAPYFSNWPTWTSTTHQQMYYRWLERAYRGGLRLMVMLAVTNEALCKSRGGTDCENSMLPPSRLDDLDKFDGRFRPLTTPAPVLPPIEAQLKAAYDFEDWLDTQSGGTGQGWFRIVRTPEEARRVISDGKLAVVLGIEVEHLFGCRYNGPCTPQSISDAVDKYYDKGVRHIFPIHNFDNQFGHPATWQDAISAGNRAVSGHWWEVDDCTGLGYGFWLDSFVERTLLLLGFGISDDVIRVGGAASCHKHGLFPLGETLLDKLMNKGMIIDIDHMSNKSLEATLTKAEQRLRPYPLVASHALFFDLHEQAYGGNPGNAGRHERMRRKEELGRIKALGGMVAVMLKDDVQDTDHKGENHTFVYGTKIAHNCIHSSKTWAHAYQYAVDKMGGGPVAVGSDFNGVAGHVGPRFGSQGCGGDPLAQWRQLRLTSQVQYPFTLEGFGTFDRQKTGFKTFDFNVDGLAHVGLLPDMVADLKTIGLSDADLAPLFKSAEGYIEVWERAEVAAGKPIYSTPTVDCTAITVPADGMCQATALAVTEALLSNEDINEDITLTLEPPGPYREGSTSVKVDVASKLSCQPPTFCFGTVTVEDKTGPSLTCPGNINAECLNSGATVTFEEPRIEDIKDNCNGMIDSSGCGPGPGTTFGLGPNVVTCHASDDAATPNRNVGTCQFSVNVTDSQPPHFAVVNSGGVDGCSTGEFVECEGREIDGQWVQGGTLTKSFTATDRCDGDITATCQKDGGEPGDTFFDRPATDDNGNPTVDAPGGTLECKATDRAGLSKTCTTPVTVRDTQNAQITCPAEPVTMECEGSGGAEVTLATLQDPVTASDACRGPLPDSSIQCYLGQFDFLNTPRTFPLGETGVTCRANDLYDAHFAHNHAWVSCSLTVKVVDTEKPTFTTSCPDNITTTATSPSGADVSWPAVQASDLCSGVNVACDNPEIFPIGNTQVACAATDTSSNSSTCNFNVQVSYPFTGFAQPVDAAPTLNVVSGGAGVPVRFGLGGDFGLNVFAAGYPKSQKITCDSTVAFDEIESTVTAGNSGLSYDASTDQYTYVWKTDKAWKGTCRQLTMKLADGTDKVAHFKFK